VVYSEPLDPHPIRVARLAKRLSLRRLARNCQIDFRRLSIVERGFSGAEIARLAAALDCDSGDLLAGSRRRAR
jgi:hypothetical protein